MGRVKRGNAKKSFMREHDCRFCLYFGSCSHKECVFDDADSVVNKNGEFEESEQRGAPSTDAIV